MAVSQGTAGRPGLEAADDAAVRCWCGAAAAEAVGADYARCGGCGTVVYRGAVNAAEHTAADGTGFYGDRYWRRYVPEVLGLPGLEERARSDLPERSVFHLVRILDHLAPGGRVLELGCGAGSLTYLLCQAGFDASGLELGPAAIEVARDRFGVRVHRGALETLAEREPFDAVVAVDVLEHLPDPAATMAACAHRLAAGGRLFLQTPRYRGEGSDWPMLLPEEHLHLFTGGAVERLLRAAGFAAVEVSDSLFPHDMWVAAAVDGPLAARAEPLAGVPPVAVALIDAYAESVRERAERDAVDADRRRKERLAERLGSELESVRGDQRAKERLLVSQDRELRRVRADQAAKEELIAGLGRELETVRRDQRAKEELIADLSAELRTTREDQEAKGVLIERLSARLESVRRDQSAKEELIADVSAELGAARADQADKQELIERIGAELEAVRADQQAKEVVVGRLAADLQAADAELEAIRGDRLYRALRAVRGRLGGRR